MYQSQKEGGCIGGGGGDGGDGDGDVKWAFDCSESDAGRSADLRLWVLLSRDRLS